jgi:hypothetical protein
MILALEDAPFVLQGPKPTIPPAAWESTWAFGLIALGLIVLAIVALRRFLRKGPAALAPLAQLDVALRLAESQPAAEAITQSTRALRTYLAAIDPRAGVSLSTEELVTTIAGAKKSGGEPLLLHHVVEIRGKGSGGVHGSKRARGFDELDQLRPIRRSPLGPVRTSESRAEGEGLTKLVEVQHRG